MTGRAVGPEFDIETAVSRASAFVHGNILVLAALVALSPDVVTVTGGASVLGTGLSTFIAHVVGEAARGLVSGTASLPNDTPARRRARYAMA